MADNIETRYRLMLLNVSTELQRRDVRLDMLKCALFEFIKERKRLDDAKTAFDLFMELDSGMNISADDLSLLNALFELLGLAALKDIIANHGFSTSDVNPSEVFSPFRISIVYMGHRLNNKNIQQIADVYKVPEENRSNQWKLLQYLFDISRLNNEDELKKFEKIFEINQETQYRLMLTDVSSELERRDVCLDMLKFTLINFVTDRKKLDDAKTPFDIFKELDNARQISAGDIKLINGLLQLLELAAVKDTIANAGFPTPDISPSDVFSSFHISIIDMGCKLHNRNIQRIADVYKVPKETQSNQWKLLQHLYECNKLNNENDLINVVKTADINKVNDESSPSCQLLSSQDEKIKNYLLQRTESLCSGYKRFTPPIMQDRFQLDIVHMFTDLDLVKEDKEGKQISTPITLNGVLQSIKSIPACKVLIEGEGGIGKTTLLRHLAYEWSHKESDNLFAGKIVFLVNIRDIGKGEDILDLIVKQIPGKDFSRKTNLPMDKKSELIEKFMTKHDDEIVLMLDGLDELEKGSESPISIFKKQELQRSVVLLTSRSININEFIQASNIHVKVKGFNEEKIEEYINKYFENISGKGTSLTQHLRENQHKELYSMCKNPMLLLLTCIMWEEKQEILTNKADLFCEIFRCILNQYNKTEKKPKISNFEEISREYVNAMCVLGKCMYKGLKKNKLLVNKKDLEGNRDMIEMVLKLGFVYKDECSSKTNFGEYYVAPHKLIVESLVGYYLYKLCDNTCLDNLPLLNDTEWKEIRENEHLENARVFAIGFLGGNADKFLKNWMINNSLSTFRPLSTHYIKLVKVEHQGAVMQGLIDHIANSDIEIKQHLSDVCRSFKMFMHHFNPNVNVDENENIISLIQKIYNTRSCYRIKGFCNKMPSEEKGKILAHCIVAVHDQNDILCGYITKECNEVVEYFVAECERLSIKYDIQSVMLNGTTTASFLGYLFTHSPNGINLQSNEKCITGSDINDAMKMCSSRGIKLKFSTVYISGNNLNSINTTSLASLFPYIHVLDISNCNLTGEVINDMIQEFRGIKFKLKTLKISGNNLGSINVTSLASLFLNIEGLYISNCNLTGEVMNDTMRECSSRGIELKLATLDIRGNNLNSINTTSLAFLMAPVLLSNSFGIFGILDISNCNLTGELINDMMRECSSRGIKSKLETLNISGNNLNSINATSLASLFSCITTDLDISYCNLTGEVINDTMRECSSREIKLKLETLDISGNNLGSNATSLASLMTSLSSHILTLCISNCNLTGEVINDTMRECSSREIKLKLQTLNISGNNLGNINGTFLTSRFPRMRKLYISNCNLTGEVINDIMRECSSWEIELKVETLNISGNNLNSINATSLASFLSCITTDLDISYCNLTGEVINDMIKECSSRGIELKIYTLNISGNNLGNINTTLLTSLFPYMSKLEISNCNLTGEVINDMMRECSSREIELQLLHLKISGNNLNSINATSLASLFPHISTLDMSNCNLTGEVINDTIRDFSSRGIELKLFHLNISGNNLGSINATSLASLFPCNTGSLYISNCNLTGELINDTMREHFNRGIKLELETLNISGNNLNSINATSLASILNPRMCKLNFSNCNLTGEAISDIMRHFSGWGIELVI